MAAAGRGDVRPVSEQLVREPGRFNFFQVVRLLERMSLVQSRRAHGPRRGRVGEDETPATEAARFHTVPSLAFPAVSVQSVRSTGGQRVDNAAGPPPDVYVSFLGLVGSVGALPHHYTRLILARDREKDRALRDFLDLFQHRLISLFYRAWEKSRITEHYARRALDPTNEDEDLLTTAFFSLIGMSDPSLRGGQRVHADVFLRYVGLFADRRRNAVSLQQMLEDYLGLSVEVCQFQGEWLALPVEDQSCVSTTGLNGGAMLGQTAILGTRVWSVQSKFRLRLGPFNYRTAYRFLPTGDRIGPMCELVRAYVGGEFRFDVQLVIFPDEVPQTRLGGSPRSGSRLGWNTWLLSQPPDHDVDDAVFEGDHPAVREGRFAEGPAGMYTVDFDPDEHSVPAAQAVRS
jgi:type VI secretion system protein ImpH